jgi:hypothetical protein
VTGDAAIIDLTLGETELCQFFHFPEESLSSTARATFWQCPEGTAAGLDLDTYLAACEEETELLDVLMYGWNLGGPAVSGVTSDGLVVFDSVPMGHVRLEPDAPASALQLGAFCGVAQEPGGDVAEWNDATTGASLQLGGFLEVPGTELVCHWFGSIAADTAFDPPGGLQANPPATP